MLFFHCIHLIDYRGQDNNEDRNTELIRVASTDDDHEMGNVLEILLIIVMPGI